MLTIFRYNPNKLEPWEKETVNACNKRTTLRFLITNDQLKRSSKQIHWLSETENNTKINMEVFSQQCTMLKTGTNTNYIGRVSSVWPGEIQILSNVSFHTKIPSDVKKLDGFGMW